MPYKDLQKKREYNREWVYQKKKEMINTLIKNFFIYKKWQQGSKICKKIRRKILRL